MPLDPQLQAYYDQAAATTSPPRHTLTPQVVRAAMETELVERAQGVPVSQPEHVVRVEYRVIPGPGGLLPIRIYAPLTGDDVPIVVYFHGGGWVLGNLDMYDDICRSVAHGAHCVVVAVEYRLAPEHPFPAAVEDCYAATQWCAQHANVFEEVHGDPQRLAVAGDSAGGNLAAVVALLSRDPGGPTVAAQALLYPITDLRMGSASYEENAYAPELTREDMWWFRGHYLASLNEITNPLVSPLLAHDLRGLPPALVVTAEYDPLRDEGEAYAQQLLAAGVPVTAIRYDGLPHGFLGLAEVAYRAKEAQADVIRALRSALFPPTPTADALPMD